MNQSDVRDIALLEDLRNKQAHLKTFFALPKKTHHPRRQYFLYFSNERRQAFETHPQGETRSPMRRVASRDARGARSVHTTLEIFFCFKINLRVGISRSKMSYQCRKNVTGMEDLVTFWGKITKTFD